MQRRILVSVAACVLAYGVLLAANGDDGKSGQPRTPGEPNQAAADAQAAPPTSVDEARARARLLQESFHATLQFVHDEYYRPDERLEIPAKTLERVFAELDRSHKVQLRWLAVNAKAMNVEHAPRDDFEKAAVAAMLAGKSEFDRLERGIYRHAGAITLTSSCLKCHLPGRTDTKDRAAALVISIPLKK